MGSTLLIIWVFRMWIAEWIGAFVAAFLISRVIGLLAKKWPDSYEKAVTVNGLSAAIGILAGMYGYGDSEHAAWLYATAQIAVLIIDFLRIKRASA